MNENKIKLLWEIVNFLDEHKNAWVDLQVHDTDYTDYEEYDVSLNADELEYLLS